MTTNSVLIVGAGPVGLTMATELARYGIPVRIVEKAAQRTDKSKALVLWSRTLELLERGGDTAVFVNAGFKALAVNAIASDGRLIGHVTLDSVDSQYPYALMLPQSDTERLLEARLNGYGVSVEREVELLGFTQAADPIAAVLRHADGRQEQVSTPWLVGCDGAHSLVRHTLGADFAGETMQSDWMLADIHMHGYPFPDTETAVYWHQDGAFVIFPITPGRYRVAANLPLTPEERPPELTLAQAQGVITRRGPPGLTAYNPIWLTRFRINERKVKDYRSGRVFLMGDAAHVHSPAGGQGMNTGMQDAFNLAWKLALAIRGSCHERILESFSAERSYVGEQVLKEAGRLTTIGTLKNPLAQQVRNVVAHFMLGLRPVQHAVADSMTEMSVGYPNSPLNGPAEGGGTGPGPGERAVPKPGQIPVGSGSLPKFALFGPQRAKGNALTKQFPDLIETALRPPFSAEQFTLVRPDGYVACTATDVTAVARYLTGLQ